MEPIPANSNLPQHSPKERLALLIGCGFGTGWLKPGPGTWGSLLGLAWAAALLRLPLFWAFALVLASLGVSIWSSSICEKLLGKTDPGEVVIDEIVSIPIAFWPLLFHPHVPLWIWAAGFLGFRILDIAKPFPIKQLQRFHGGLGILLDDVAAALFTSAMVYWLVR